MQQTIKISGLKQKYHPTKWDCAIDEVLDCLNREPQAVLEFIGAQEAAGNVSVNRNYDAENDTITIVREWNQSAWDEYQTHSENMNFIISEFQKAGYTVEIS